MAPVDPHLDAERLAEYADGVLSTAERSEVELHLLACSVCREAVAETMAFNLANPDLAVSPAIPSLPIRIRSRRWLTGVAAGLAVAAALALALRARPTWVSGLFGPSVDRPELQELVAALANEPTRPVAGRLTGGFKYAPPPLQTRGPSGRDVAPDVRIAAATITKRARELADAPTRAALGVAYLATGDIDKAVESLERAAEIRPTQAEYQSDLAASYLARAQFLDRPEDWSRALTAADRAIRSNPNLVEAYFNRALALVALHRGDDVTRAWQDYLARDPNSAWSSEARRRLQDKVGDQRQRTTTETQQLLVTSDLEQLRGLARRSLMS